MPYPTREPGRAPAPAAALESALTVCTNVTIYIAGGAASRPLEGFAGMT